MVLVILEIIFKLWEINIIDIFLFFFNFCNKFKIFVCIVIFKVVVGLFVISKVGL